MRRAEIRVHNSRAGMLEEIEFQRRYRFTYDPDYTGPPVSLTMPVKQRVYDYEGFPPFFEGLLPEGYNLEALLRIRKIDRHDYFSQLVTVGDDTVGAVTIIEIP